MADFALMRRLKPGELINGIEHTVCRRAAADDPFAAEFVPNLPVMLACLLEQSGRTAGNVLDGHIRHGPAKLGESLPFEVETPRIFGRKMHRDFQRRADLAQDFLLGLSEGIPLVLRNVPTRLHERYCEGEDGG